MKRAKRYLTLAIISAVITLTFYLVYAFVVLLPAEDLKYYHILVFLLVTTILTSITAVFAMLYLKERSYVLMNVEENMFNLNRKNNFYNHRNFIRDVGKKKFMDKRKGYIISFTPIRSNINYFSNQSKQIVNLNGFISDFIYSFGVKRIKKELKTPCYWCYSKPVFLIYVGGDSKVVNEFVESLCDEVFNIGKEHKFRLYLQPYFGIVKITDKNNNMYELIRDANIARQNAEDNFQTVMFFDDTMVSDNEETTNEIDKMLEALKNGEFKVYYQPKYSLTYKKFTSSEALIRWETKDGIISPGKFIALAENNGIIHDLDMFVLETTLKDLAENKKRGRRILPVSVNFSLYEFYTLHFVEDIIDLIEKYKVQPSLIEIEITENTSSYNSFLTLSIIKKLKSYGVRILMDDFGMGYSNLASLKKLPVDVVKIDKSFIDLILEDFKSAEIVRFMIQFCKANNLQVVAEGVDNKEQVEMLKKMKLDVIQGFYYSKPLSKDEFDKFLSNNPFEKKIERN